MRILSSGEVGIGLIAATAKLHIKGATNTTGYSFKAENLAGTSLFQIQDNANLFAGDASGNIFMGQSSGANKTSGYTNTGIGYLADASITSGFDNTAFGAYCLSTVSTGSGNTGIGEEALRFTTGDGNTAIGKKAGLINTSGSNNTAIGFGALNDNSTGSNNTAIGQGALFGNTGTGSVGIGFNAGAHSYGTDTLYIDNRDRTIHASELSNGLVWAVFASTKAGQSLNLNGAMNVSSDTTNSPASTSGYITYSEPMSGKTYKKVIAHATAALGTASYTFPVPFTFTPVILTTSGLAAGVVTSLSTTAITITGVTTTGFIILEGY